MFAGVFRDIDAYEILGRIVARLGQREFGIDDANEIDAGAREGLEDVGALQREIHAGALREVPEKANQLNHLVLFDYLQARGAGFPAFIDRNDHPSSGDGKDRGNPVLEFKWSVQARDKSLEVCSYPSNCTLKLVIKA